MHRSIRLFTVSFVMFVLSAITAPSINAKGKNITIDKNDQKTTVACTDNAVTVTSEDNNITLSGGKPPKISQKKGNDINIVHNGK